MCVCVCMYVYNCFFKVAHTFYLTDLENVNPYSLSNIGPNRKFTTIPNQYDKHVTGILI